VKNVTKPVAQPKPVQKEKSVDELLAEGKSLGEIQTTIQMRKPYYQQLAKEEDEHKVAEAQKQLEELIKDPFKDPTQELID
jgi:hypothetical protein